MLRVPGSKSCIRLTLRRKVLLPHPEGPIRAVTLDGATSKAMSKSACLGPYQNEKSSTAKCPWVAVVGALIRTVR